MFGYLISASQLQFYVRSHCMPKMKNLAQTSFYYIVRRLNSVFAPANYKVLTADKYEKLSLLLCAFVFILDLQFREET